ncbi:MAG: hypothetical protein GC134_06680 [Proteobacteria bacterium]|nr:hypothetical protein [Pseudomonadota bacterium]
MDSASILLEGIVTKAQSPDRGLGDVAELLPYFREQGLDLKGFHPDPLVVSIAPKAMLLKKPLSVFKNVRWSTGRVGDVSFFPCKMTFQGMPFFGFVYIDHSAVPDSKSIRIIAPPIALIKADMQILVEIDAQRASVA